MVLRSDKAEQPLPDEWVAAFDDMVRVQQRTEHERDELKARLIELTNEGWYSQVQRLEGEIERLERENQGLTETISEWQEIHGTFVANPEIERLRTALQEISEHCQYCCREAQAMANEALGQPKE